MNEIQLEIKPKKRRKIKQIDNKQYRILSGIANGYTDKEIAQMLKLSTSAISRIVAFLIREAEVVNRSQLIHWAYQNKILKVE